MKPFAPDIIGKIEAKNPLAMIDEFTLNYASEEDFDKAHREFFSDVYQNLPFAILTNLDPDECTFNAHIEYKVSYNSDYKHSSEIQRLDPVFSDNNYLNYFLKNSDIKAKYDFDEVSSFAYEFYDRITHNPEFYSFALERIKGNIRHVRYTDRDSYFADQMKESQSYYDLRQLTRYKTFRAATMTMYEYDKMKEYNNLNSYVKRKKL